MGVSNAEDVHWETTGMRYWRMAMREGNRGRDRFPDCFAKGIAALDYWDEDGRRIVGDCRRLTPRQFEATLPSLRQRRQHLSRSVFMTTRAA